MQWFIDIPRMNRHRNPTIFKAHQYHDLIRRPTQRYLTDSAGLGRCMAQIESVCGVVLSEAPEKRSILEH